MQARMTSNTSYINSFKPKMKFLFLFVFSVYVIGCVNPIRPTTNTLIGDDHIFYKNFEVGQKLTANIGEPVLKVKNYTISRYKPLFMRASSDFEISGGIVTITGDAKTFYPIIGEMINDDQTCTVLALPSKGDFLSRESTFGVLIKKDGSVQGKVFQSTRIFIIYSFSPTPPDLKFIPLERAIVDKNKNYLNFDLVYGGVHDGHLFFTYREFSADDLEIPVFFQNISYGTGKKIINFRDIELSIHSVTNENIEFTVLSEDYLNKLNQKLRPTKYFFHQDSTLYSLSNL